MVLPIAVAAMLVAATQPALPLPARTDIPSGLSTVLCPDEASARRMLEAFYRVAPPPNNHTVDIPHFFAGLEATGCRQNGAPGGSAIEIESVLMRRILPRGDSTETVIAYRGRHGDGRPVTGIVSETFNDRFPRTPLEVWLGPRSDDGRHLAIDNEAAGRIIAYRCPSLDAARASVAAMPQDDDVGEQEANLALEAALAHAGCAPAPAGRYRVAALHEIGIIDCGHECIYEWTALETVDANGDTTALIYDGSLF